ncbi:hypothetical protein J6590_007970 [Homalodisca vitripennis]|nr:hypothetical protein J6590_007970 [Homalodisca vitripennis]
MPDVMPELLASTLVTNEPKEKLGKVALTVTNPRVIVAFTSVQPSPISGVVPIASLRGRCRRQACEAARRSHRVPPELATSLNHCLLEISNQIDGEESSLCTVLQDNSTG